MALNAKANTLVAANAEMAAKAWVAPTPHEAATTLLGRVQLLESVASMEAAGQPVKQQEATGLPVGSCRTHGGGGTFLHNPTAD